MATILDKVKVSNPGLSASHPKAEGDLAPIEDVRNAVIDCLKKQPGVRHVDVTKLVQIDAQTGAWEAEAEVSMPNATIRDIGLPVQKEVLDRRDYILRLDRQLNIVAYGLRELVEKK